MDKTIRMNCFVIRTAVIPAPAESQYDYFGPRFRGTSKH